MAGLNTNYNDLCRICAAKTSILVGINIFEGEGTVREINKKIATCLPIQIHAEDELPKMICGDCVYNLDLFFNFREKSLQTENFLRSLIKKMNDLKPTDHKITESTMNIVIQEQQLNLQNQEILGQNDMRIVHELAKRECGNISVEEDIILNPQNININHALENIDISTHELPSDDMTNVIHQQDLNLHHDGSIGGLAEEDINLQHSQLSVQNLDLIHTQHNLIEQFEQEQIKNNDNKMPVITIRNQNDLLTIKSKEDDKSELKKQELSASSDSDVSSDLDFDPLNTDDMIKNDDSENQYFFEAPIYTDQSRNPLFNSNEISTINSNGTQWYYCNICSKALSDKDEYFRHYEDHLLKCMICETVFSNLELLNAHRVDMHSKNEVENIVKNQQIDSKPRTRLKVTNTENSKEEVKKEDSENEADNVTQDEDEPDEEEVDKSTKRKRCEPKVCKECGKHYKTNYKLQEHMRKHTGEQPYKCKECDKAFRSKIGLAQHEAKHTGHYDFSCPTCGKGFQCRSYLIVHQRVHSDLKPYPCTTCGSNFKTKQSLLDHMNRHLGVKPYLCDICGRGFITKGLWKSHQKVHSGMDNRQYPCTVCNKMFVSKSYLATHLRIHTGEKPFMCEVCGKGFLTRVDLRIHSTMHTGEKSFICEMCGKAFARRDALRCHRRSHTGERPYKCDICGQTFTQFSPMAIHKRLHTGERPYSCEVCSKTFVSRSTMMSHRKKHIP